jgi:hypothetical protein
MSIPSHNEMARPPHRPLLAAGAILCCAAAVGIAAARPDDPPAEVVGTIEGESIVVEGPMKVDFVRGQARTVLRSGSQVRVKAGTARIDLAEGGQIAICGPAHLSLLKSRGSLTVALDSGIIHVHIEREPALTVYTPQIQAKPVAIGDAPRDSLVGLDATGAMCLRASSGAIRIEQQLTGQAIIVPQGGEVTLSDGQINSLRTGGGRCICEPPPVKPAPPEVSTVASAEAVRANAPAAATKPPTPEKPAVIEEPVYQVFMPPLAFDATAKTQPEFDPQLIVLVRRARVRAGLVYRGRVAGESVAAAVTHPPSVAAAPVPAAPKKAPPANGGVMGRVRNFLRRIWTHNS